MIGRPPDRSRSREVRLIGSFQAIEHGRVLTLKLTEQRLLAFLALQRRRLSRCYVAGSLWPKVSEDRAYANLRTSLWRCRPAAAGFLCVSASEVRIDPAVHIDVAGLIQRVHDVVTRGDSAAVVPTDLQSDILEDWYDDWVVSERERYRQIRLHLLEMLCERRLHEGRHAEAVDAAMVAVAAEPLRESANRLVIRAHIAEGNVVEALRHYARYEALVGRELRLPPGPVLQALVAPYLDAGVRPTRWRLGL